MAYELTEIEAIDRIKRAINVLNDEELRPQSIYLNFTKYINKRKLVESMKNGKVEITSEQLEGVVENRVVKTTESATLKHNDDVYMNQHICLVLDIIMTKKKEIALFGVEGAMRMLEEDVFEMYQYLKNNSKKD